MDNKNVDRSVLLLYEKQLQLGERGRERERGRGEKERESGGERALLLIAELDFANYVFT